MATIARAAQGRVHPAPGHPVRAPGETVHEYMSKDDLLAGLRKLGFASAATVKLAVLEATGHVSAVGLDEAANP